MDIHYRLYPYPVLTEYSDDYVGSRFSFSLKVEQEIHELILNVEFKLKNEELSRMIESGQAQFLLHIECSQTCYRSIETTDKFNIQKKIADRELNGKVSVCAFIIAKQDLPAYSNRNFNPDYGNTRFEIDSGSILAIAGQYNLNITKDTEELAKTPSIFTICKYAADTDEFMTFDYDTDKIVIKLSEKAFENYRSMVNMPSMLPVTYSMMIVPALIYVFEALKREEDFSEFEPRRWFMAMKRTFRRQDIELDRDTLERYPSYELAQRLLDTPIGRALDAIVNMDVTDGED